MEQTTCGQGLAQNSVLPAHIAKVIDGVAGNLEAHMKSLDLADPNSRREHDAYLKLLRAHRDIAAKLQATAELMAEYRDLPMGRHDQRWLQSPQVLDAFQGFVSAKQRLLALLQHTATQDQELLAMMVRVRTPPDGA